MTIDPANAGSAGLIDRAKNIIMTPSAEFDRIDNEAADLGKIYTGYVLPLAITAALCSFVGLAVFGIGPWRMPMVTGLINAAVGVGLSLLGVYLVAVIANALAPNFGSQANAGKAHQLIAYSWTPAFLASVFSLFPPLAILGILGLYAFALLYIGLPRLMKTPEDKRVGYFIVLILVGIVVNIVVGAIAGQILLMLPGYSPPNPFAFS